MSKKKRKKTEDEFAADRTFGRRAAFVGVLLVAALSLLSWRLIELQYIRHEELKAKVLDYHTKREILGARRGQIFDRNGDILVIDVAEHSVYVDKYHIDDLDICAAALAHQEGLKSRDIRSSYPDDQEIRDMFVDLIGDTIAPPLGMQSVDVVRKIKESTKKMIVLAKGLNDSDVERLKETLAQAGITFGVNFQEKRKRSYTMPDCLTHVLGYTAATGNSGIEKSMNGVLQGVNGYRTYETDRKNREVALFRGEHVEPKHGKNVRLTIDIGLQRIVEDVLNERGNDPEEIYAPLLQAKKISVVLIEPKTGAILALANRPHFDLITRKGNWRNSAVCDQYEPGSTFKIVAVSGALEGDFVRPHQQISLSPNGVVFDQGVPVTDDHVYRSLTVEGIIFKSSNIGAFKLASQIGRKRFHELAQDYGFGERTGVLLPNESGGKLWNPKDWRRGSQSRMAMGYQVAVTPLQMVTALSAIVNDGVLIKPRIVDAVFDDRGIDVEVKTPEVVRRVISKQTAAEMRAAMEKVCLEGGTGTRAVPEGYTVAGKTSTAQRFNDDLGRYHEGHYVVSFMGYVPADDPELIGIVVVDDPRISRVKLYGGTIAAPLFRRIAGRAMDYFKVEANPQVLADTN